MFGPYVDLHTHTTRSDGSLSPEAVVKAAYDAGIRVMSITDHNCTEDLTDLRGLASSFPEEMTLIQGAEISAQYLDGTGKTHELHIVALGFDPKDPDMKKLLANNRPDRRPYIEAILKRLREECGIDLGTYDTVRARFPNAKYIGRMALARLMTEAGITATVDEAFDRFLGSHGQRRAYVKNPLRYDTLENTVRCIIRAGGIPVLAHLLYYDLDDGNRTGGREKERLVRYFKQLTDRYGSPGGMEVYYVRYKEPEERLYLLNLCRKYGLMISAGSDYHAQESWETLAHRTSCSVCSDLLAHLGVRVRYPLAPAPLHVISGFSGVGKGAICAGLGSQTIGGKPVALIRSVTNRPARSAEENYTFVTREEFAELVARNQLLEYNASYNQKGYGTPVWEVREAMESGKAVVLEIDRIGLARLLTEGKINPGLIRSVFIVAAAGDVAGRLCRRGTEDEATIRARLETAMQESRSLHLYDAVVVNNTVADALADVIAVFEGRPVAGSFDPAAFREEMTQVLAAFGKQENSAAEG